MNDDDDDDNDRDSDDGSAGVVFVVFVVLVVVVCRVKTFCERKTCGREKLRSSLVRPPYEYPACPSPQATFCCLFQSRLSAAR